MSQNSIVQTLPSKPLLTLDMRGVNQLFSGFALGDFVVLHGSHSVLPLASLLYVRAQLPPQLGGLGSNVVFVDGGNTFRLYQIARLAQFHGLNPKEALDHVFISRAFTAYQLASLVMDKLKAVVADYDAKLVVVSDIAGFFLDKDVREEEARSVFRQVTAFLSRFAREKNVVLIVTYPPHKQTRRNSFLHALTCGRASVVIALQESRYGREFILEKHPRYLLGSAKFPSETLTLAEFMEGYA